MQSLKLKLVFGCSILQRHLCYIDVIFSLWLEQVRKVRVVRTGREPMTLWAFVQVLSNRTIVRVRVSVGKTRKNPGALNRSPLTATSSWFAGLSRHFELKFSQWNLSRYFCRFRHEDCPKSTWVKLDITPSYDSWPFLLFQILKQQQN